MRVEFRIPISPTDGFFAQVRFYNAALRRLGGVYGDATLTVVVGDKCDIDDVVRRNSWSAGERVRWVRLPDEIFDRYWFHGTADWRYVEETDADVVILSDADSVLVRDVDPVLDMLARSEPAIAGHMAHYPPWTGREPDPPGTFPGDFWQKLFAAMNVPFPAQLHRYSVAREPGLVSPVYFNLGFVALNAAAMAIFRREIFDCEDEIGRVTESVMRCQIAVSMLAYRHRMHVFELGAAYNAANDPIHFAANGLRDDDVRVIHYLRGDEIDRSKIFLPEAIDGFLEADLQDPVNRVLQALARNVAPQLR